VPKSHVVLSKRDSVLAVEKAKAAGSDWKRLQSKFEQQDHEMRKLSTLVSHSTTSSLMPTPGTIMLAYRRLAFIDAILTQYDAVHSVVKAGVSGVVEGAHKAGDAVMEGAHKAGDVVMEGAHKAGDAVVDFVTANPRQNSLQGQ